MQKKLVDGMTMSFGADADAEIYPLVRVAEGGEAANRSVWLRPALSAVNFLVVAWGAEV